MQFPRITVFGIAYEGIENFRHGTSLGPAFFRFYRESIEIFSLSYKARMPGFEDIGDLYPPYFEELRGKGFADYVVKWLEAHKIEVPFIAIGGDHFITYPLVKYLVGKGKDFYLLHIDAHLDVRDSFEGEQYNHATVIRRLYEVLSKDRIISVGIRSRAIEEYPSHRWFKDLEKVKDLLSEIEEPVYITIDLDVLDPAIFPGVSNPEPGGYRVNEIIELVESVKSPIAIDIVEFNPLIEHSISGPTLSYLWRELLFKLNGAKR